MTALAVTLYIRHLQFCFRKRTNFNNVTGNDTFLFVVATTDQCLLFYLEQNEVTKFFFDMEEAEMTNHKLQCF